MVKNRFVLPVLVVVCVVQIRRVDMAVGICRVCMRVAVFSDHRRFMNVIVMPVVMAVAVFMLCQLMQMLVLMPLKGREIGTQYHHG